MTDAATKLGASKTQISGQAAFVDTLMKANERTIGTLVDADMEEESTRLKALQTQQQLGVQSLASRTAARRTCSRSSVNRRTSLPENSGRGLPRPRSKERGLFRLRNLRARYTGDDCF